MGKSSNLTKKEAWASNKRKKSLKGGSIFTRIRDAFQMKDHAVGPPSVRKMLRKYGISGYNVVNVQICRTPVASVLTTIANALTLGKMKKEMKAKNYDQMFHLYMVLTLKSPTGDTAKYLLEKNERLNASPKIPTVTPKTQCKSVNLKNRTLSLFYDKTRERMGNKFFVYTAEKYNCQNFVSNTLKANGITDPALHSFILQDVSASVRSNPWASKIMKGVTDLGKFTSILTKGKGVADLKSWNQALKIYNQGSTRWCIPKKGSTGHKKVLAIMRGESIEKKPKPKATSFSELKSKMEQNQKKQTARMDDIISRYSDPKYGSEQDRAVIDFSHDETPRKKIKARQSNPQKKKKPRRIVPMAVE